MNEKELKILIKKGESQGVEFKESLGLKDEIGECVSAFSNTNKGLILVGVSDSGEIKGVQIGRKTVEALANYIKQHTDNPIYPKIKVETADGKNMIVIEVDEHSEKPVFFRGKAYGKVGKSVHRLSASEIRKLAKESKKSYWDEQICEEADLKDIDKKKVKWYLEQREKHRNISKQIKIPFNQFLKNIKTLKDAKPTNAGILFFGKNPLLKLSSAQLRLVKIKGKTIDGVILDRLDCEGALWEMIEQAEKFLKEHINFMGFRTAKSFQRVDKFDIPIKALRELIINALIHRDYETTADARVFIFDDRVEIINPGTFPKGVTPNRPLHKPVNKVLSQYMYDVGFIEKYGSGIVWVKSLLKENGNKDLNYVLHEIETKAIVYSQVSEKDWLRKATQKTTQKTTQKILEIIKENPAITRKELASIIGISESGIKFHIIKLKKKGLLKRIGPDKGGYWELVEKGVK